MNTSTISVGALAIIVLSIGAFALSRTSNEPMMDSRENNSASMDDASAMMKDEMQGDTDMAKEDTNEDMMEETGTPMAKESDASMRSGTYEAYAPEKLAMADAGSVVLFFKASWCPSCRALDADIKKNLSTIPSGVHILTVDYDTEAELKKKYAITYQHTLVEVAADGTQIEKWSGSPTLTDVLARIK